MRNFVKIRNRIEVKQIYDEVTANMALFDQIKGRQELYGSPHKDTKTIFLRWSKDQSVDGAFADVESVDYPALDMLPSVRKMIAEIAKLVIATQIGKVILTSLRPGGIIDPHIDEGPYSDKYSRFHLPIVSLEENNFYVDNGDYSGEFVWMREGELWWFNHKSRHWVYNGSEKSRLHLIVDAISKAYPVRRHSKKKVLHK